MGIALKACGVSPSVVYLSCKGTFNPVVLYATVPQNVRRTTYVAIVYTVKLYHTVPTF